MILKTTCPSLFFVESFLLYLQLTGRTLKNFPNMVDRVVFFLKWGYSLFSVNYSTCVSPLLFDRIEFSSVICDCRVTLVLFGSKFNANHQRFAFAEGLFGAPRNSYLTKCVLVSSRLENAFHFHLEEFTIFFNTDPYFTLLNVCMVTHFKLVVNNVGLTCGPCWPICNDAVILFICGN